MDNVDTKCTELSLEDALIQCRTAAERGYRIAKNNLNKNALAIDEVAHSLNLCLRQFQQGKVRTNDIVDQLNDQLTRVVTELERIQKTSTSNLKHRLKDLQNFSVVLFGRTMAGKSTLMEILTSGDGHSIGKGSQRTTRDVRPYSWNGLKIVDVPGVAAFGGSEDEDLALTEASRADLVLFLITDDAPQAIEAECLIRVLRQGKPVIGVCNVKAAVDNADDLHVFLGNPARHFNQSRLDELVSQFHNFIDQDIPGKRIEFIATHLRSRFLSQRPTHIHYRDRLLAASRFADVESSIIHDVVGRGSFLRVKSFIDGAVVPMIDVADQFLQFSDQNQRRARVMSDKHQQFCDWAETFRVHGQDRIRMHVSQILDSLRQEAAVFADDHFEDSMAGEKWHQHVQSAGIDRKTNNLQRELFQEFNSAASEVARELQSELALVAKLSGDRQIKMNNIFNLRRTWNWTILSLAGGLALTAAFTPIAAPLFGIALVIGTGGSYLSNYIQSREEKVELARQKLIASLRHDIGRIGKKLHNDLLRWFGTELVDKHVAGLLDEMVGVSSALFKVADSQSGLAWKLTRQHKKLSRALVDEALAQLGANNIRGVLADVARLPGHGMMLKIRPKTTIDWRIREGLETLLGEQVWLVVDTKSRPSLLAQAIGPACKRDEIKIQREINVAHVTLDETGPELGVRVQLAKQLAELQVIQ